MINRLVLTFGLMALAAGCGTAAVDQPYDSCNPGDTCAAGFTCASSTLPQYTYTGTFCTIGCASDTDCQSAPAGFGSTCVLYAAGQGQCYLTCSTNADCPYSQACGTYQDAFTGAAIGLCTP